MTVSTDLQVCPQCHTQVARALLSCPVCGRLAHADRLGELAARAEKAASTQDVTAELALWREALQLLPPDSRQHKAISAKVGELSTRVDESGVTREGDKKKFLKKFGAKAGIAGAVVLGIWKFKLVILFILTKGKLLLLGLTKSSTILTMLVSLGVYWAAWGWLFALGLVLSIYVHEMGHVAMLRRYGIAATAPMFIPGLGALVMMKQHPSSVTENARVGMAGPVWGFGAAAFAYGVSTVMGWPSWAAIAKVGAWLNLFNLFPIWQLDGGRAFSAFTRAQRWIVVAVLAGAWLFTRQDLLILVGIGALFRAFGKAEATKFDSSSFIEYIFLVVLLSWMCLIPVNIQQVP